MFGLDCRLDRIQGCRTVFVFGNPIIKTLCATVGFSDVTSANIVGYMNRDLEATALALGPSFVNVSGEDIDLVDISVTGYEPYNYEKDEGGARGDVQMATLTAGGNTATNYKWYDYTKRGDTPDEDVVMKGWYKVVSRKNVLCARGEVTLQPGEGLWSNTLAYDQKLVSSGEVATKADVATAMPASGMMIATPLPVNVDLVDMYVRGYDPYDYEKDEGGARGDVQVSTLTAGGNTDTIYKWYDYTKRGDTPDEDVVMYGWYKVVSRKNVLCVRDEVVLASGEGLWTNTLAEDQTLYWPKVEVAK